MEIANGNVLFVPVRVCDKLVWTVQLLFPINIAGMKATFKIMMKSTIRMQIIFHPKLWDTISPRVRNVHDI